MNKKILFGGSALTLVGVFGLILYVMSQMGIEHLISCSLNERGTRIPNSLCKYYLVNYRATTNDINRLKNGAGLDYIINGDNQKKYDIAKFFISKGLSVDSINHYSKKEVTPLVAAVLYNDVELVRFLIIQGANIQIKSNGYRMTALELAKELHRNVGKEDRSEIIKILSTINNT